MRPLILLSNDDGFQAPGVNFLAETLRAIADIVIVSPDSARSGFACSITCTQPLRYRPISSEPASADGTRGALEIYACTGTPTDCVKLALDVILHDRKPALVIGGINHGDNSSVNSHYSGTMGVATEGAIQGFPSIAFSICNHSWGVNLAPTAPYLLRIAEKVIADGLPAFTCLNVNFPDSAEYAGVKVCRMAHSRWIHELAEREDPRGGKYYWLVGEEMELEVDANDTDRWALAHNYVAITPTTFDNTAYELMRSLSSTFND